MKLPFALAMAVRESRSSRRRIGLYMGSITLGVAALVAINSFRADVTRSIHHESRRLLGADLELHSRMPFPAPVQQLLDSLAEAGTPVSYVTSFPSMALALRSEHTRLVQVRALTGRYPYYGTIETAPPGRWAALRSGRHALVDPAALIQLDAEVGDTLAIGQSRFTIAATLTRIPGEVGIWSAIGPRIYVPGQYLEETGLLRFGSRARYVAYLEISDPAAVQGFLNTHTALLEESRVGYDTAAEREEELTDALDVLARFLGLVGLIALLLGGIGVASAVHVYVKDKLDTVAVLRCLGATQRTVFGVYLLQAAFMGFLGAGAGVVLGLVVQANLPTLLGDFLPLEVTPSLGWRSILAGLGVGVWVAVIFALLPLLGVRNVTPLRALRREFTARPPRGDWARIGAYGALVMSVVALSMWQAPWRSAGLAFAGAVAATTGVLWTVSWGLTRATRRFFPRHAPYVLRQGIANLFRPHNQTVAVILAVGFGVFLLGTLHAVQRNLLEQFAIDARPDRPNLVVFDIQEDQRNGVREMFRERELTELEMTPIVPARIAAVNGRAIDELLNDTTGAPRPRWPLTREYRNTYRDTLVRTEELVAGEWWEGPKGGIVPPQEAAGAGPLPRISLEEDVAQELRVGVGDRITWDVQGVRIETRIASLRRVNWARFEPNFFAVFEPGVLGDAPQSFVTLTRVPDVTRRAQLQHDLVRRYPNILAIDLSLIQQTIDTMIGSVALTIRFMALFSLASGIIVLLGAIATSRFQRLRESVLLKTLGARAEQIGQILLTEYFALGTLAGLTGVLLAGIAAWALITFFFELTFRLSFMPLVGLALAATAVTTGIGLLSSREVFRRPPLAVMREMGE